MSHKTTVISEQLWTTDPAEALKSVKLDEALLLYPTATLWSVGCVPAPNAINRLQQFKHRQRPFLILWKNKPALLSSLKGVSQDALRLMTTYCDQHVSCIVPQAWFPGVRWIPECCVSDEGKVAFRVDQLTGLSALIEASHYPAWLSSSANLPDHAPVTSLTREDSFFEAIPAPKVLFEYDGPMQGQASTLIDIEAKKILRQGSTPVIF